MNSLTLRERGSDKDLRVMSMSDFKLLMSVGCF